MSSITSEAAAPLMKLPPNPLRAAVLKRPRTNLVPNQDYALTKDQMQSGFMAVFNWAYSGDPRKTMLKLAFSPLMNMASLSTGKMPAAKTPEQRKERKNLNQSIAEWEKKRQDFNLAQYTTLKKVNAGNESHFLLGLPIVKVSSPDSANAVLMMFGAEPLTDEARETFNAPRDKQVTEDGTQAGPQVVAYAASKCLAKAGLNGDTTVMFAKCLQAVRYYYTEHDVVIFLEFKILPHEAQYLVSEDWAQIRPVDLYPLFTMWVEAEYVSKKYGKSATSMSKIAQTLPKHLPGDERVDQFNISINMKGEPLWIPKECDNTVKYETMFSDAGQQGSGEFALRKPGAYKQLQLPVNIPILTDWVNNKFTYSNATGKPQVIDLAHFRKCNAAMAMNLMKKSMKNKYFTTLQYYGEAAGLSVVAKDYGADTSHWPNASDDMSIEDYANFALAQFFQLTNSGALTFYELMDSLAQANLDRGDKGALDPNDPAMLLAPLARFVVALGPAMIRNIDSMYSKYAVITMTEALGMIQLLASYGSDLTGTQIAADTINKPAINQGIDKNWQPGAMPLVTKKFSEPDQGLLPHQYKVRNMLRHRPDLAALPVDAGGGKSMLAITDVLEEIKHGESEPYLIMCPSHLVANYVSEIVEFTDGKVNVIPVTSYNIRTTGIARFTEILEAAPINTILIVDYDALKFRSRATVYGTTTITVYPVIELIRQFQPGYVFMDESHFLRNVNSARMKSVMTLVADIKKKRLASGTMNPDSPSDLPGQMAILDPTVFGTRSEFNEQYGEVVKGQRVISWKRHGPNAVSTVLTKLRGSVVWAGAKRKEWACALPERHDHFIKVNLTPRQKEMYDAIFDDMVASIRKAAESDKNAKALLEKLTGKKASAEDEEKFGDLGDVQPEDEEDDSEDDVDDVGPALQPYLADIERFVTNPGFHPYARNGFINAEGQKIPPLTGDDLKSPKAIALEYRLREYLNTHESKAIIFTNYNESTDSLFNAMPDDLKACGLLYKTSSKTEMVNAFKKNPKIRWMIGIRKSLEVGLNLQQAGYLCRMEGVWTPGEQEQGDARIERPNFGPNGDKRTALQFDTIVANRTIDVTKAARLRAKIVALAKFDNNLDPAYQAIPDIPVIPMTLETIQTMNDFDDNLAAYQESMNMLSEHIKSEYAEYKKQILAAGGFKFTQVAQAPTPPGAALLARVPYAQGTELYNASEMGLVRVDNYLGMELTGEDDDDDAPPIEDDDESKDSAVIKAQRAKVMGMRCHCEFGDGVIFGAAALGKGNFISRVHVALDDGTKARGLKATNVFVMTRTETNSIDMRNKIAQAAGLDITAPITVPGLVVKQSKVTQKQQREQEKQRQLEIRKEQLEKHSLDKKAKLAIGLQLSFMNGYMRLHYDIGTNQAAVKALQAVGFQHDLPYYQTRIKSYKQLITQVENWLGSGKFELSSKVDQDAFEALAQELANGTIATRARYMRMMSGGNFRNYLRQAFKPSPDRTRLCLFSIVTDGGDRDPGALKEAERKGVNPNFGVAYLCLPSGGGFPGSKLAVADKYKAPGTRWTLSDSSMSLFVNNLRGAAAVLNELGRAGVKIENGDEIRHQAANMKKLTPKDDDTIDRRVADDEAAGAAPDRGAK